jgi:DNA polymerase III alpha subunit
MTETAVFPQLRVRTGFSFRNAYGKIDEVIARLKHIGADTAAIVDHGTWGHVKFEKAALDAGINPIFGMEIGRSWILARDTKAFYQITSQFTQKKELDLFGLTGVVRFAGGDLDLPRDEYDFADINAASFTHAKAMIAKARLEDKPMILTSFNDMPGREHAPYAYAWEVRESVGMRHITTLEEMWSVLSLVMSKEEFDIAVENTYRLADELKGQRLAKAPIIKTDGDLLELASKGKYRRLEDGSIKEWTQEYEDRFVFEIEAIKAKGFDSYFLVVEDLITWAKNQDILVGPGRGSSAGSLVCYLLGITESVDPIQYGLLFQRFIDISRADLPDIDIDFPDTKRHLVFKYLQDKYGRDNVSKMGNVNTLQAASVLAQVGKKFGIHVGETMPIKDAVITYTTAEDRYGQGMHDTMKSTDAGVNFAHHHPEAAYCMGELETHYSHAGVHAAAILVCNEQVTNFCTVNEDGIAQIDKPDAEYLNLLKVDALGLRTLGVISDANAMTPKELYALKFDDQNVLSLLNEDKTAGLFQFEGPTVRATTRAINVTSFNQIDHITALARPGPLTSGMTQKYIDRASGKKQVSYDPPQLEPFISETLGVLVYQEQVMEIVKNLGDFDWTRTSVIRKAMSNSKGEEFFNKHIDAFIAGAGKHGISEKDAKILWKELIAFGKYAFNKSHSAAYSVITYWCMYLKKYHTLAFCAATLREAKDDEQTVSILRELEREGVRYTAIDPEHSAVNWQYADGRLLGGILNAKGYGPVKALQYVQKRAAGLLKDKDRAALAKAPIKFADLHEAHTRFGHFYDDPTLAGVTSGNPILEIKDAVEREDGLFICKLIKKVVMDENSPDRIKRRNGKLYSSTQSKFLDLEMADDSIDGSMVFRIRPELYLEKGEPLLDALAGSWFLVKGWRIKGFDMLIVKNIKAL